MLDYQEVINKFGTPSYLYDINVLINRINYLKTKLSRCNNLVYAVKANTFITKEIEEEVEKYEICSKGEFDICEKLGVDHKKMVISGVYKDLDSIEEMISNYDDIGVYTIESLNQLKLLEDLTTKYKKHINILIRLTSGNQFGVNEEDFKYIVKNNKKELITINGIEYFSGTQKHSISRIKKEIDYLNNFIKEVEEECNIKIKEVEYGVGFPVFYYQDDLFDEDSFLEEINNYLMIFENKVISIEVGRSIAASCGSYLTKVVDLKTNKNGNFVIVDGGINHLVYYGQNMAMRIPYFEIIPRKEDNILTNYSIYGSLCTVNDCLLKNINVAKLELNDVFIFKNVGAYSVTEGISLFLSRNLPKVIIYNKNKKLVMVRDVIKTSDINFPNYNR